jgi:hypothetical protein
MGLSASMPVSVNGAQSCFGNGRPVQVSTPRSDAAVSAVQGHQRLPGPWNRCRDATACNDRCLRRSQQGRVERHSGSDTVIFHERQVVQRPPTIPVLLRRGLGVTSPKVSDVSSPSPCIRAGVNERRRSGHQRRLPDRHASRVGPHCGDERACSASRAPLEPSPGVRHLDAMTSPRSLEACIMYPR